jgi:hypothetical protein
LKKFIMLLIVLFVPVVVHAADAILARPYWSVEIKGGLFAPALADWAKYYGDRSMPSFAGSVAYKPTRQVDIGISIGFAEDKGHAFQAGHNAAAGEVTYRVAPVNVFVLLRGVWSEDQWVVPYAGGGYTSMYYQEKIESQGTVNGSVDGYHARGGLQFLLDGLDGSAAHGMYQDYGVQHTYLFGEVEYIHAVERSGSVNLGGTAYYMGFLFEF